MKKQANLKICVLGGRNFGKTSLLSSLILISGDKSSGITVSGGNEQKLSIYNEYKNNNGKLIATNWDDICKFRYNLTGNGNQRYKLTFIDYPGEFFQKFFSDSGAFSVRFLSMFGLQKKSSRTEDANRTFTKNEVKFAKRLVNELKNADAFIVLLPADVTKDIYKVNLQIFKTQLQVLLENIHNINPYIPVCLAINKWDMFGKAYTELSDILQSKPYKDFDNMLNLECGEYYFCQAISAFGKNRSAEAKTEKEQEEFKEEWDRKSEPVNVMQMLLKISEVAEKSRYLHLREKYKNASWFSKIFHFPAMLASLCRKGANAEEDRNFCTKKLTRCTLGLIGTVASVALLCFVAIGALTTLGEFTYLKIQESSVAEVEKSLEASKTDNTTAEKIEGLKETLAGHPLKLAFFCKPQVEDLSARITEIEQQYNLRVWQNAVSFCDNDRNKDEDPSKLQSKEREARCESRIQHLEREQAKLTDLLTRNSEGRTLKVCFDQKIEQEKRLLDNIRKDGCLDDALHTLTMTKDEEECRYIESLIDQYESTYSYRKDDFDNLRKQLNALEKSYHDKLLVDLEKIKDFASKDFNHRINLAQRRINRIEQERQYLSTRSSWHKVNDQSISAEKQNIENWKHDSKFYAAFDAAMKPGNDQIQRLVKFLKDYDKNSYSRCAADWDKADKKKNELIAAVNSNLEKVLTANSINIPNITAVEKAKRLQSCINEYEQAKKMNPVETEKYDREIAALRRNLKVAEKDRKFEAEYNKILASGDEGKLKRIHEFVTGGEFAKANFTHKSTEYKNLERIKKQLIEKWQKRQKEVETKYADDAPKSRAIRLDLAKKLLAEYNKLLLEYLPSSSEYDNLYRLADELKAKITEHKKYNKLFNAFNKIEVLSDSFHVINEIAVFEDEYTTGEYPETDDVNIFQKLQKLKKEHSGAVRSAFNTANSKVKKPHENDFSKLAVYYQNLRSNADNFIQKLSPNVAFYKELQNIKRGYNDNITKYQQFAKIAAVLKPLISDDEPKNVEDARSRLSAIKAFYANEDFSNELASAPELGDWADSLKKVQAGVEKFIDRELSNKLEEISKKLPMGASSQEQIANWGEQLDLIEDFCLSMIQRDDNALYSKFRTKHKDLQIRLGKKKLKTRFDSARSKLDEQLMNGGLNVTDKITRIDDFIGKYSQHEDFKDEISSYQLKRNAYDQIRKFASFEQECNTLISAKPQKVAGFNDLKAYRDNIRKKLDRIKEFESFSGVQQRAEDLKKSLSVEIEYVKKAIGDGSWNDICSKEEAYKNNPTESTYASLKYAIDRFDAEEYSSYKDQVKEIKRNYQADWQKRKDIQATWETLKRSPTTSNWTSFANSCINSNFWAFGYNNQLVARDNTYSSTADLQVYKNYYNELARSHSVNVEFISVAGLQNLGTVSGKLRIRFKLGDNMLFDMKFTKPNGEYRWKSGQWRDVTKGSVEFPAAMKIETKLNYRIFSIGNWSGENTYDNIHVDAVEILVPLIAGETNVRKWYSGYHGVTVGLKFTK